MNYQAMIKGFIFSLLEKILIIDISCRKETREYTYKEYISLFE